MAETESINDMQSIPPELGIQALALALFDRAGKAHSLPARARRQLHLAAACLGAAQHAEAENERPDRLARDRVLAVASPDLSPDDQAIVACTVALQRAKVRPQREPAFLALGVKDRKRSLRLAAILRVAGALDAEPVDNLRVKADQDATALVVGGERATELARRADERADLWRDQIGALSIRAAEPGDFAGLDQPATNRHEANEAVDFLMPGSFVQDAEIGGQPIAEAARQQLRRFFDKLLAREDAVRDDEDIEDVHQMRVATRRLRASLQVVEYIFDAKAIRRYRRGLRQVAQSLGAVRDGDVFLEHLIAYRDSLPAGAQLEPLIAAVSQERAQARKRLLADLDAKGYKKLKRAFAKFLTTPGAHTLAPEAGPTPRVRDFAGSAILRRYEQWRAYETTLPSATDETLHQTRIAGKHLRYTLEFFADALGPGVDEVLQPLVELQECLGALQDGVTARAHVTALKLADDPGAREYLSARDAEHAAHLAELAHKWENVASADYRRRLLELLLNV